MMNMQGQSFDIIAELLIFGFSVPMDHAFVHDTEYSVPGILVCNDRHGR